MGDFKAKNTVFMIQINCRGHSKGIQTTGLIVSGCLIVLLQQKLWFNVGFSPIINYFSVLGPTISLRGMQPSLYMGEFDQWHLKVFGGCFSRHFSN